MRYSCVTRNREQLDRHQDFDELTWTCLTCQSPVHIELDDGKGNTALVVQTQAQHLRAGQHAIYLENDLSQPHPVRASEMTYKGGQWHLRLQGFGMRHIAPGHYFNCLSNP